MMVIQRRKTLRELYRDVLLLRAEVAAAELERLTR